MARPFRLAFVALALATALAMMSSGSVAQPRAGGAQGTRLGGPGPGPRGGAGAGAGIGGPRLGGPRGGAGNPPGFDVPAEGRGRSARVPGMETRRYVLEETGEEMIYAVFVPRRVKRRNKPAPLVLGLHGMGSGPDRIIGQIRDEADKRGYIVVAPMGYSPFGGWGAYPDGLGRQPNPRLNELSEIDAMNVLDLALKEFNVDERRIYLVGQSMGGAGALHLGPKYSDIWAAVGASAAAMAHTEPTGLENALNVPFILVHGDADPGVPVEVSRRWVERLEQLGMTYEYYEFRGGGHADAIIRGAPYIFDFFDKHSKAAP